MLTIEFSPAMLRRLGKAIKRARVDQEVSQQAVADAAGITPGYLSQVERGVRDAAYDTWCRIASALAMPLSGVPLYACEHQLEVD